MSPLDTLDLEEDTAPIMPETLPGILRQIQEGFLSRQTLEYALRLCEGRRANLELLKQALLTGRSEFREEIEVTGDQTRITVAFAVSKMFFI